MVIISEEKKDAGDNSKFLQQLLQQSTNFELRKVPCIDGNYLQMFLNWTLKCQYVVKLEDDEMNHQHCVGVDCVSLKIYECLEPFTLTLTRESFDICCGRGNLKKIQLCYEITTQGQKSTNKIYNF